MSTRSSQKDPTILVTGATGRVGGATLRSLVASGRRPIALVRNPDRVAALPVECDVRVGDMTDPEALEEAVVSVDALLICSGHGANMLQAQLNLIDAARAAGVRRIVKISGSWAASFPDTPAVTGAQHVEIEAALAASGIEHTNIRPNAFSQLLATLAGDIDAGVLPLAFGDSAVSLVDVQDVGAVAAAALVSEETLPELIEVAGPEAVTGKALAAIVSDHTGTTVTYQALSDEEHLARMSGMGAPDWLAQHVVTTLGLIRDRDGDRVTDGVQEWTGDPATSISQILAREGSELGIRPRS